MDRTARFIGKTTQVSCSFGFETRNHFCGLSRIGRADTQRGYARTNIQYESEGKEWYQSTTFLT